MPLGSCRRVANGKQPGEAVHRLMGPVCGAVVDHDNLEGVAIEALSYQRAERFVEQVLSVARRHDNADSRVFAAEALGCGPPTPEPG